MKSPFAILIAIVILIGIGIGVVAIVFLGPSEDGDDSDTIPIASQAELPTPSTRNEALARDRNSANDAPTETDADEDTASQDEAGDSQENPRNDEPPVADTAEQTNTEGGTGALGGGRPGGGDFQAIQDAIANNPELAELIQKAQSGNITQAEQARIQELMQEVFAEAGIQGPGGQGGGFGTPPIQGTISAIDGSNITIDHADESGLSTDISIDDNTSITVINMLAPSDLNQGDNVAGTVQRGEGGRIFIVNLTIIPEQQGQGFGGGLRGALGGGFGTDNDATNLSNINGSISEINDQTINVETTQGILRLTANDESNIVATTSGTLSDIAQGMSAIAFGGDQGTTPIRPNNLIVGPEDLLQEGGAPGIRGAGRGRQGAQGQ